MTLIELMIAMILGLIIVAGVLYVFQGSSKTFRTSDALARVQENGRFGLEAIASDIRMASYSGCGAIQNITPQSVVTELGTLDLFDDSNVLRGYTYTVGAPIVGAIVGTQGVVGSDVFIARHLSESVVEFNGDMALKTDPIVLKKTPNTPKFVDGQIVAVADCTKMDIFRVTNVVETTTTVTLSHAVGSAGVGNTSPEFQGRYGATLGSKAVRLIEQAYYVKNTGRLNKTGQPVFALFRQATSTGLATGNEDEIAEGVEDLRISYGLDTIGLGQVDRYVSAGAMTTAQWPMVRSMRLELLVASIENGALDAPQTYTFNGANVVPAATDRKLRTSIGTTISLRNRDHVE
ncbi:hypothetical protein GCM10027046_12780 [Uliginosibacterium flavum]